MLNDYGNMLATNCNALVITTNGFVKPNGQAVMGRGIAAQVAKSLPSIPAILGKRINTFGNKVHLLDDSQEPHLISFPVKPVSKICTSTDDYVSHANYSIGQTIPGFHCKADIDIIKQSALELVALADVLDYQKVILPRAGCGAGELSWKEVEPILASILDDRFIAMTWSK